MSALKALPGVNPVLQMFLLFIVTAALAIFGQAHAADKAVPASLAGVSGYDGTGIATGDGPLTLSFSGVASDGKYTVTASRVVGIFTADPGIPTATKSRDTYDQKKFVWIVKSLPPKTMLLAIGLGSDWAGTGPAIDNLDLSKALASGVIENGTAKLDFVRPAGQKARVVTWVVVLPDGKRAWGPNGDDSSPYHLHIGGKPATGWRTDEIGQRIPDATKLALKGQK